MGQLFADTLTQAGPGTWLALDHPDHTDRGHIHLITIRSTVCGQDIDVHKDRTRKNLAEMDVIYSKHVVSSEGEVFGKSSNSLDN